MQTKPPLHVFRVTPSLADRYARCPRAAALAPPFVSTPASRMGQNAHRAVEIWAKGALSGRDISFTGVLTATGLAVGSPDAEIATVSVTAIRDWISHAGLSVVAAEQYITLPPRPLLGHDGLEVELSGRIDLVARDDTHLYIADLKTGNTVMTPAELAAQPSSTIYTILAQHYWRDMKGIVITHIHPVQQQVVMVELTSDQLEAGRASSATIRRTAGRANGGRDGHSRAAVRVVPCTERMPGLLFRW